MSPCLNSRGFYTEQMLLRRKSQHSPTRGDSLLRYSRPLCALPYHSGMRDAGAIGGAWMVCQDNRDFFGLPREDELPNNANAAATGDTFENVDRKHPAHQFSPRVVFRKLDRGRWRTEHPASGR
jgi:hypothetical protein